jgi:hypothetical protein
MIDRPADVPQQPAVGLATRIREVLLAHGESSGGRVTLTYHEIQAELRERYGLEDVSGKKIRWAINALTEKGLFAYVNTAVQVVITGSPADQPRDAA